LDFSRSIKNERIEPLIQTTDMPSLPSEDAETVSLSVQGSLFVLRKDLILAHDWMPAKILTSEVTFQKVNGVFYLDVDSSSFRLLLSILSGVAELEQAISRLPPIDLSLLISTARYLLCLEIADTLEEMQMKSKNEVEALKEELSKMKISGALELSKVKADLSEAVANSQRLLALKKSKSSRKEHTRTFTERTLRGETVTVTKWTE
jgi:hypothetical protein